MIDEEVFLDERLMVVGGEMVEWMMRMRMKGKRMGWGWAGLNILGCWVALAADLGSGCLR